ncbi:MAG: adenylate/guanylate cyclase domain-containing protein [Chloroflexota bacterium]
MSEPGQTATNPDPSQELPAAEPGRRRAARALPDLAALFEEVDQEKKPVESAADVGQAEAANLAEPEARSPGEDAAAAEEGEKPAEQARAPKARPSRGGLPDLAALFEEVDQEKKPDEGPAKSGLVKSAADVGLADLASLAGRRVRRAGGELAALEEGDKPAEQAEERPSRREAALPSLLFAESQEGEEEHLSFPPELEGYLSPDLWRKLKSPEPARGALLNALERVRSVLYLLSTFLPRNLVQEKMNRPYPGRVEGQMLRGSLLFSDVSGFTALSERLAVLGPEGAEQLTAMMNQYFAAMLEILSWSGGILIKFAGDAMLVYFPEQEENEHARWAMRAGQRMLRAMADFARIETPSGVVGLKMKIGLASGEFLAASVGSEKRMEYFVLGQAVGDTMAAEGLTRRGGQMVVNALTTEALDENYSSTPLKGGFCLVRLREKEALGDFEIKAETRRARGAIPWSATPRALLTQTEVALRQVQALRPYLAPELAERIITHARQRQVDSEYRPTTVMFCNFTGPEKLLAAWGASGTPRVTNLLSTYFNAMQQVIERYGGIVSRVDPYSKGTKMLILFGAPVAHEDDPQRAVSAALAMNAELEALEENWRRRYARHLPDELGAVIQHRIGITFGETFAGQVGSSTRREYTVMGDDVNLAARLMGAAEMGQILINPQVQQAVGAYFVLTPLPAIRVKGKSRPIPIYQVDGPRDDTLASRVQSRGALVGRQAELEQGEAILQQALQGKGRLLTILGPAGIGKSHLADALLKRAEAQGAQVLLVQCHSYQAEAHYASWGTLLRSLARVTSLDDNPQVLYHKLVRLLARMQIPDQHMPALAALLGLSPGFVAQQQAQGTEVEEAGEQPGGAAQEEAAFDFVRRGKVKRKASSLDVLQQLERQDEGEAGLRWTHGLAQLSQAEQEGLYQAVWSLIEHLASVSPVALFFEDAHWMDAASRELLKRLSQRATWLPVFLMVACRGDEMANCQEIGESLVLSTLKQADTAALVAHLLVSELAEVIYEQSNGNPLFVDEITRWFKRTHNLSADELRSVLQASNFLHKLILGGLEVLPEQQREIIKVASVIGNEFRTGEVYALLDQKVDSVTLSHHLRALAREQFIRLMEAGTDARYTFQQSLVRDILYGSLPFDQRRSLHAKMAAYLSAGPSKRRSAQLRIAAALEFSSGSPTREAEAIAFHYEQAQEWLPAAQHLVMAGDQARLYQAYEKAATCYGRALEDLDQMRAEGEPLRGGPVDADAEADALRLEANLGRGDMAVMAGDYLTAAVAYEAARAGLDNDAAPDEVMEVVCNLALVLPMQGKAAEALKLLRKAARMPEAGENPVLAATLAWLLWRTGKTEAGKWIRKSRALVKSNGDAWAAGVKAMLAELAGKLGEAQEAYIAQQRYNGAALVAIRMGDQSLEQGDLEAAREAYCQAEALWRSKAEQVQDLTLALYRQAEVHWRQQDLPAARQALEEAQEALPGSALLLQAQGQTAIQRALKTLNQRKAKRWPAWRWQAYEDAFRIAILFQA